MPFSAFAGNRKVVERLQEKLRQQRLPHGLAFSGPDGIGKRTCALMLAKALNCAEPLPGDFCGVCAACRKIDAGVHPDVVLVGVEEGSTQIRVPQIRAVTRTLEFHPLEGRNKIFIIDPAEAMNPEAANALLKGLEEPPENSFFMLLTRNVHELLRTIRSRVQTYPFVPLTLDELAGIGDPPPDALVLRWARGSVGALQTLDLDTLKQQREASLAFLETAARATPAQFSRLLGAAVDLSRSRQDLETYLDVITVLLEDLLYLQESSPENVVNIDLQDRLQDLAGRIGPEGLSRASGFLRTIESGLKHNANRQMLVDALALTTNPNVAKILHDNHGKSR